jgi:choline monooxygenase
MKTALSTLRSLVTPRDLRVAPLERSDTIPSSWYTDPRFLDVERSLIFPRTWQYIGHQNRVPHPGDQSPFEAAGNPVITVRDKEGEVWTFYNVCKHRGGPIAMDDCSGKVMQCKYHGWTYLLDGSLRGTPRFDRTELFDKKDFGLTPVHTESWEGLLFASIESPLAPLIAFMDGIASRMQPHDLRRKRFYKRLVYPVRANWKVYVDNYLEGYHLPFVHPDLTNLLDYQNYVTETHEWYSMQYSGIAQTDRHYGAGQALYFFVFPNFMLNILPGGRLQTNIVLPTSPTTCNVVFDYYYDDIDTPEALKQISEDIAYSDHVQHEDAEICEAVQKGLESRAYDKGRFSVDMENGVYHFQQLLKRVYAGALSGARKKSEPRRTRRL